MLDEFTRNGRFARIDKDQIAEFVERHPRIRAELQSLNALFQHNRVHFGYRIFDEISRYLSNNRENGMLTFDDAFDQAVFMKVLPKFTGSKARLRAPLHSVLAWALYPGSPEPMLAPVTASFESMLGAEYVDIDGFVRDAKFRVVASRSPRKVNWLGRYRSRAMK